jgi:hypothetical protein
MSRVQPVIDFNERIETQRSQRTQRRRIRRRGAFSLHCNPSESLHAAQFFRAAPERLWDRDLRQRNGQKNKNRGQKNEFS